MSQSSTIVKRVKPEIVSIEAIPDLKLIYPKAFPDERGFFSETYNMEDWANDLGFKEVIKQDNHSYSKFGVLRGLHTQPGMGKLVSVISGKIFDVAVDIRPGSETYGKWHGVELDAESKTIFWIPSGFLHGFQCLSKEGAHVVYKCSAVYDPKTEFGINPFDEDINITWPLTNKNELIISERDQQHGSFKNLKKE